MHGKLRSLIIYTIWKNAIKNKTKAISYPARQKNFSYRRAGGAELSLPTYYQLHCNTEAFLGVTLKHSHQNCVL